MKQRGSTRAAKGLPPAPIMLPGTRWQEDASLHPSSSFHPCAPFDRFPHFSPHFFSPFSPCRCPGSSRLPGLSHPDILGLSRGWAKLFPIPQTSQTGWLGGTASAGRLQSRAGKALRGWG